MSTTDPAITSAGMRAEIDALTSALRSSNAALASASTSAACRDATLARCDTERDALAAALATRTAERDEALSALAEAAAGHRRDCNGSCDIELARRQVGPDADVPTCARECAELWEREAVRLSDALVEAAAKYGEELARVEGARATAVGLASDYKTRAEQLAAQVNAITSERDSALADIRACEARIKRVESESNKATAEAAELRQRVADLEARPVLTEERLAVALDAHGHAGLARKMYAHLGPVTLPAQDRAEELNRAYESARLAYGAGVEAMRVALAKVGAAPTTPSHQSRVATEAAALLRKIAKVGALAQGGEQSPNAEECIDMARRIESAAPTTPPAEVFAGVSVEELGTEYWNGVGVRSTTLGRERDTMAGIRAVLARLKVSLVAPVDPVAAAIHVINGMATRHSGQASWTGCTIGYQSAVIAAMRATLTARGIPVTPEVGK